MSGEGLQSPVLLVQCCHFPQFFFIERLLRQQNPELVLHALVVDHPDVRQYLQLFEKFPKVHFPSDPVLESYSDIIVPLLNRGYVGLKRRAWKLPGQHWESDYAGQLRPLTRARLIRSYATAHHAASPTFVDFLASFPQRPLRKRILILNSAHESLLDRYAQPLRELIDQADSITKFNASSLRKAWRELRGESFDAAIVFFSGECGLFHLKIIPFLKRIPQIVIFNESGGYFQANSRGLARFWFQRLRHGVGHPKQIPSILLLQSEVKEYVAEAAKNLRLGHLYPEARITVLCKHEDRDFLGSIPEIDEVIPYSRRNQLLKTYQVTRDLQPDIVSAVFSGRPLYFSTRMLFLGLLDRPRLVFNAQLDYFWLTPRTLLRLRERGTLLLDLDQPSGTKVVVVQTEALPYLRQVVQRVKGAKFYPKSDVVVLAQANDAEEVARIPGVKQVIPWSKRDGFLALRKTVRKLRPEAIFATFTRCHGYARQKLFFMLFRGGRKGVFNARLDAYWLSLKTYRNLFRSQPPLFDELGDRILDVLLIQTEERRLTTRALERTVREKAVNAERVAVFCSRQEADHFKQHPLVDRVFNYEKGDWKDTLRVLRKLRRERWDAVVGLFTGRPIFRLQKLLFLFLPARHRLVFNPNLDCFYLKRTRVARALRLPRSLRARSF